jgi:hypothetical protein
MFGLGLRYKLERAETALRAALAERDDLASANFGGSLTTFAANSIAPIASLYDQEVLRRSQPNGCRPYRRLRMAGCQCTIR